MQMRHISINCWVDELGLFGDFKSMAVVLKAQRLEGYNDEMLH